jgi:hypothetical protein
MAVHAKGLHAPDNHRINAGFALITVWNGGIDLQPPFQMAAAISNGGISIVLTIFFAVNIYFANS